MKKNYLILTLLLFTCSLLYTGSAKACYATFTHTNACAGDTLWVYAGDTYAVQFWDFGDTANGPNISYDDTAYHIYTTPGTYYITHFVNIGAEWAFETQVVTITANCFKASFTSHCDGSYDVVFTNTSTGNNLTYAWDFGDPASGVDNTSTLTSPYHLFTAAGNYNVTLIITDGTQSDTVTQVVTVDTVCMSVTYSYMFNTCLGDTTFFNPSYNNVTSVFWDFGDPAAGPANYSTSMTPYHIYSSVGLYTVMLAYSDGVHHDTLILTAYVTNCNVFPADCNRDGYVSPEDLFPIGLYYGSTGPVRSGATLNFTSQPATNWSANFPDMYLQDMVDRKHADCNGDGIVNATDVTALGQNFGMMHTPHVNMTSSMQKVRPTDPTFKIQMPAQVSHSGGPVTADLLIGTATVPCPFVYGYAVSIPFDPAVINAASITVDFAGTWLDTGAQANLINWYHVDATNHTLYIASVRTNQMGINGGYGAVAHIHFNISQFAPAGNMSLNILPTAKLLSNSVTNDGIGRVQHFLDANITNASAQVLGVNEVAKANAITVSPIPATRSLHISLSVNDKVSSLSIVNATGQVVRNYQSLVKDIDVSTIPNGIYWLKVVTTGGSYEKKIEILH